MNKISKRATALGIAVTLILSAAHAREIAVTYVGDPDEALYREIAEVVFSVYAFPSCEVTEADWKEEAKAKYRRKKNLDPDTILLRGKCVISGQMCIKEGKKESCFQNGGFMWLGDIDLSKSGDRAKVGLNLVFLDQAKTGEARREGILMQELVLDRIDSGWGVTDRVQKLFMDTR
jgi:hypothetical protein